MHNMNGDEFCDVGYRTLDASNRSQTVPNMGDLQEMDTMDCMVVREVETPDSLLSEDRGGSKTPDSADSGSHDVNGDGSKTPDSASHDAHNHGDAANNHVDAAKRINAWNGNNDIPEEENGEIPEETIGGVVTAWNDMIENENETLRDRVGDLEKRVHSQNDEITCLRATLADCLRRINSLESTKSHVQVNVRDPRPRRDVLDGKTPPRRPMSGSYSSQDFSGQARIAHEAVNRKSALYQSTGSLHSDGHSSNSMSPAPSPSPTTPLPRHASPGGRRLHLAGQTPTRPQHSPMSGSMGNLHQAKKWSSTSDFRDPSPGPNNLPGQRRQNAGSLVSLRSPFGSQQNLDRHLRHGTKDAQYSPEDGLVRMFVRGRPVNLYAPTPHIENYSLAKVNPAPTSKLRLEWVYGYRGRDARANLYLLPTGEMIYFVAAVVVLYNVEEQSQRHYLGHTEDIKCIAIHPNKMLIATGQAAGHDRREGRPHIRVWNSVSLQTLHVLGIGDFERAISCLSFSKADGGNLLVAVDEAPDHNISIWDWQRGEKGHKITETKCSTETVVAAEFHPLEGGTVVTCGKGHVNFWQLDNSNFTLSRKTGMFDQRDKPKYVTCLAFSFTGDVLTGDSNGNVFIWGRGYNAVTKALRKIHDGPIFSICVLKDGSIVTGGGKDGRIVQFDTSYRRTGLEAQLPEHLGSIRTVSQGRGSQLLLGTTKNSILTGNFDLSFQEIMVGHVEDVWALAANPTQPQFITAGHDRMIHLWDSLSHSVVWSNDVGEQAQSACFSPDGEVIVVGTITGKWVVLDSRTREVFGVHQDGGDPVHTVKFSPNGQLLALGSRDNAIYMYQVNDNYRKYSRMGRCMGHSSYLTHLDWSSDSSCIQSNSAEHELVYWNASVCRPIRETATLRDVEWATGNCVISWATIGVWGETVDSPDINSVARSHDKKIIATGDDMGKIKLFSSPASQPKSLFHTYGGHSSQVTKVAFLSDDTRLISVGGRDTAIIQWVVSQ